MRVTVLAGGTGGTKLAHGFAMLPDVELSVVVNVGDDAEIHGLLVCPDIDAVLYTLSGLIDTERGWGVRDDTHTAHAMFERYGEETWFTVGDADLATHAHRTRLLRQGASLTDVTAGMASALGIGPRILPASDGAWRTVIRTDDGTLAFQEYFVRRRQEPDVRGVDFEGAGQPTPAVLAAIAEAEMIVIGPSNPIVSIGPILALPGIGSLVGHSSVPRVAVSPIVAGQALKGPADRMLASLGHEVSAVGVARMYVGLVGAFVIDEADAALAPAVEALGMRPIVLPTVMRTDEKRATLAAAIVGALPSDLADRSRYPARVAARIIIPHRGLEQAKTRLATSLSPEERIFLASQLLQRVLKVSLEVTQDVVVISPSRALREIVEGSGARLAVQRGMGLNEGLEQARFDILTDAVETMVVLHGDLPNLQATDVETLMGSLGIDGAPGVAIAPDRAGTGTNGLVLQPPGVIGFQFGPGSFAKHLAEVERAGVPLVAVNRAGLAFDLDTPADLARWLELGDAA